MKHKRMPVGTLILAGISCVSVQAAQQSMSSVTEQAQIQPIEDGSGKYMMKSDGFYCFWILMGAEAQQQKFIILMILK